MHYILNFNSEQIAAVDVLGGILGHEKIYFSQFEFSKLWEEKNKDFIIIVNLKKGFAGTCFFYSPGATFFTEIIICE